MEIELFNDFDTVEITSYYDSTKYYINPSFKTTIKLKGMLLFRPNSKLTYEYHSRVAYYENFNILLKNNNVSNMCFTPFIIENEYTIQSCRMVLVEKTFELQDYYRKSKKMAAKKAAY